jgi:predicted amidohydrolase
MATAADPSLNARKIRDALDAAAGAGAELLVVPECALSGYLPARNLDFAALAAAERKLAEEVRRVGIWLAYGTARREDDQCLNTALLLDPRGEQVARYDKTHLTRDDRGVFAPGGDLPVFRAGAWKLAIQICFDMRFPENWRILRRKGAQVALHLSNASRSDAWKVPVLEGAVRSRAAENGMFVVSANDARRPQMMVSAICDPDGEDLARAPENEEVIIYAELDRSAVKQDFLELRRTDLWDTDENRRMLLG